MTKTSDGRWTESVLYTFKSTGGDAAAPNGGVIRAKSGKLYGTGVTGGEHLYGAVFEITS